MATKKKINKHFQPKMIVFYLVLIGGSLVNFWGVSTWGETHLKASDYKPTFEKINPYAQPNHDPSIERPIRPER